MMRASRLSQRVKTFFLSEQASAGMIRLGLFRGIKTMDVPRDSVQIRLGLWERETYKYIRQASQVARWVIDIGAGSGELSLYFSLRTRATPIIAIEPWTPHIVRQNMQLNNSLRIEILEKYLGSKADQTRLDALEVPWNLPGFIKLDADGAELDILQSGERLLREARPLLLVETHSAVLENQCSHFLSGLGYDITIVPNAWWRTLVPEQRPEHNRWLWASPVRAF